MPAFTPLEQTTTNSTKRINLEKFVGYPLGLEINTPSHPRPLFWRSLDEGGLTTKSTFLEATGFSLDVIVSEKELARLPSKVLEIVNMLPSKSYQILQAILISSAAKELALSNPLLFILLIIEAQKQGLSEQAFKALVKEKRTKILSYLNLPARPSVVRILARTKFTFDFATDLDMLPQVLSNSNFLQVIQHVKQPSMQHFLFARRYARTLTTKLLNLITPDTTRQAVNHISVILNDCWRMEMQLNQLNSIASLAELDALHDRLVVRYNLAQTERQEKFQLDNHGDYPKPPLPGNKMIVPLTSWPELMMEGAQMKHCVASYHSLVANGEVFIYQVHASKRLTLAVNLRENKWVLGEIKGVANTNPIKEDLELIHEWYFEATNQEKNQKAG